jgi:hypothetical protein
MAEEIIENAAQGELCSDWQFWLVLIQTMQFSFCCLDGLFNNYISTQDYKAKWTPIITTMSGRVCEVVVQLIIYWKKAHVHCAL